MQPIDEVIHNTLLDEFAATTAVSTANGVTLRNECADISIDFSSDGTASSYRIHGPAFSHHPALDVTVNDIAAARTAYATRWVQWVTVTIGKGFHPDTPADQYGYTVAGKWVDGLGEENQALLDQYDEMIEYGHENLEDIYEIGYDAMIKAEIAEPDSPASTPAP